MRQTGYEDPNWQSSHFTFYHIKYLRAIFSLSHYSHYFSVAYVFLFRWCHDTPCRLSNPCFFLHTRIEFLIVVFWNRRSCTHREFLQKLTIFLMKDNFWIGDTEIWMENISILILQTSRTFLGQADLKLYVHYEKTVMLVLIIFTFW